MRKFFLILCLVCAAQGMSAQTDIHDKYSSKSEACEDGTYRKSDGYKKFGQIGWEMLWVRVPPTVPGRIK